MPVLSVNSVCIVFHKQVELSLLPAEPTLSWKEKRVVKTMTSCIPCWASADAAQCKMALAQSVAAAQREVLICVAEVKEPNYGFLLLWDSW